jgi:cation:H+ antiporter
VRATTLNIGAVIIGVGLLAAGSTALVRGAVGVATSLHVSDTIIGLTIVAAGTSTPELVTSIVAAWRGRDDIAVANVVGSNIFNILGIAGCTAFIHPLPVPTEIIARDNLWMLGASLVLFPLMKTGMRVNRVEGAVLLVGFTTYMMLLILTV